MKLMVCHKMSSLDPEEDTELRDLVANTLQSCGVLGKIKAQLRSNVYLALDGGEQQLKAKSTLSNNVLSDFVRTSEGRLVLYLVREFLAFLRLDCTLSVFEAEAIEGRNFQTRGREDLIDKLGLINERIGERRGSNAFDKVPLLSEVLRLSKVSILKSETPSPTENSHRTEEESSLRSSAIDESGTNKSSLTPGLGLRNPNSQGGLGSNAAYYGLSDRSNPGSVATTPPQSLTPESSLNPVATKKLQQSVVNIPNASLNNLETASTLTSVSASSNQNIGSQSSNKKPLPKDIQEPSKNNTSADFSIQSASQQFATSKSSSTSSSFSSVDPSLPDRNISKGVFSNQSSLGDLPPLGGSIGTSSRNTLAPLKKIPSPSSSKPQDNSLSKEQKNLGIYDLYADLDMPEKSSNKNKSKPNEMKNATGRDVSFGKTTSIENQEKTTTDKTFTKSDKDIVGSRNNSFSRSGTKALNDPIIGKDDKLDSSDEDIEEDIDNFLDSQMSDDIAGTEDDFTKDETVASGEDASIKADFVMDLKS